MLTFASETNNNPNKNSVKSIVSEDPAGNVSLSMVTVGSFPEYGTNIPFNITVDNQGANDIYDVVVTNTIPVGYTFDPTGTDWIPTAAPNVYTNTIAGPIANGSSELITINLVPIAAADSTDWINVAEITEFRDAPGGTICVDSDASDNIDMTAVQIFDLALRKELFTTGDLCFGQSLVFRTYVMNQGNTPATNIEIIDFIPEGYTFDPTTATNMANGWSSAVNPTAILPGQLNSNEETYIEIELTLVMEMFDEMAWNNYTTINAANDDTGAERGSFDADSEIGTNTAIENMVLPGSADDNNMNGGGLNAGEDEDDHDPAAPLLYDLALEKVQVTALPSFSYDELVVFRNNIYNQGNQTVTNIEVVDYIPCGLEFDSANNPGWTYNTVTRIAHYTMSSVLAPAQDDFVEITLTVVQCYEGQDSAWTNFAEIAAATDMSGMPFTDVDSVMDSIMNNDGIPIPNQLDGGGPKANEDEDDHDIKMIEVVDLALRKRILEPGPYNFGDTITFVNTIYNQGNIVLDSIQIRDYLPSGYSFPADINPTWSLNAFGNPEGLIPDMVFPEDTINYELNVILVPANDETDYYNFAEIILVQDTTDSFFKNRFDDADSFVGSHLFGGSTEPNVVPDGPNDDEIFEDGFAGGDSDDNDVAAPIFYDLALSKSLADPNAAIDYGMPIEYIITVTNEGTILANNITVTDYLPCGLTIDMSLNPGWNLDVVTGYITYQITEAITPGASVDLPLNLSIQECDDTDAGSFTNVAEISVDNGDDRDSTPDDTPGDDPDEDDIDGQPIQVFDLSLTKEIGGTATSFSIGDPIVFTIEVTNEGGDTVQNVKVVDYLTCGYAFDAANNTGWTLNATSGFLEFTNIGMLPPGESFSADLNLTLQSCTTPDVGNYVNGAEISSAEDTDAMVVDDIDSTPDEIQGNEDPDEDDYDEVRVDIFDLNLDKSLTTSVTDLSYGEIISYDITVTNEGTVIASGIEVTDYIPCGLSYDAANNTIPWVVDATTGYASYTLPNDIGPGESSTVTILLTLESCTDNDSEKYNNKAEISVDNEDDDDSTPDDDPDNDLPDEDDNDDEPLPIYDLSLMKEVAGNGTYSVGDMITFDITVTNEGSEPVQNVKVVDYLPCGYAFVPNNGWTLNATTGLLENTYTDELALGESFTLSLELTIVSCDQGGADNYLNGAEISSMEDLNGEPVDDSDSTPDETQGNEDPDEDDYDEARIDIYDLSLSKVRTSINDPLTYGSSITYDLTVTNEGSLPATNFELTDYIPCGLLYDSVNNAQGWSLNASGNAVNTITQTILPGDSETVSITLVIDPCPTPTTDSYNNIAEISNDDGDDDDSTPDDDPDNDVPGEDDIDDEPLEVYDLAIDKSVIQDPNDLTIGDIISFEMVVTNEGNRTARDINVIDYVPCGLSTAGQNNPGWTAIAGSDNITYNIAELVPGASETIEVSFLIVTCDTPSEDDYNNETEITDFDDENGDEGEDVDSTPDDIPGDPPAEDDNDLVEIELAGNLGGDVWKDLDFDGIHDTNEPAIEGMTVNLFDCDGNFIRSTTTGQTGFYVFLRLPTDNYQIQFDLSSIDEPCIFTEPNVGIDDEIDSDAGDGGFSTCIEVEPGMDNYSIDAGLIENLGSIGDFVFMDLDADGIQDFGENGIEGVTVYLYTEGGLVIDSTVTDNQGAYRFNDVSTGSYYIGFGVMDDYLPTLADQGNNDENDSDITGSNGPNTTDVFVLAPGENSTDIDGGFYQCATICGYTWLDMVLENDLRDPTENGINGMKVTVFKVENGVASPYDHMNTGINPDTPSDDGYFNFCVPPGRYYLEFTLPPLGLVQVLPLSGPQDINSDVTNANGIGTTSAFTMTNGGEKCDIGAGYTLMSQVGNAVWFDENQNGLREVTEAPVQGVMVQAYDLNDVMVAEAVTDENGIYNIDYLQKKDYYLKFTADNGMAFTQALVGGDDELDSDVDHSFGPNTTRSFLGDPGSQNKNMDAGLVLGVLPVEWGTVKAEHRGDFNLVSWSTLTEINNEKFWIQRASDASGNFVTIGEVQADDLNSSTLKTYSFEDRDLIWSQYYYRIVQVDVDGRQSNSEVVAVNIRKDEFLLYPNPTDRELRISNESFEDLELITIKIYDQAGKLAYEENISLDGASQVVIPVEHLPTGLYSIDLIDNGVAIFSERFIRK